MVLATVALIYPRLTCRDFLTPAVRIASSSNAEFALPFVYTCESQTLISRTFLKRFLPHPAIDYVSIQGTNIELVSWNYDTDARAVEVQPQSINFDLPSSVDAVDVHLKNGEVLNTDTKIISENIEYTTKIDGADHISVQPVATNKQGEPIRFDFIYHPVDGSAPLETFGATAVYPGGKLSRAYWMPFTDLNTIPDTMPEDAIDLLNNAVIPSVPGVFRFQIEPSGIEGDFLTTFCLETYIEVDQPYNLGLGHCESVSRV